MLTGFAAEAPTVHGRIGPIPVFGNPRRSNQPRRALKACCLGCSWRGALDNGHDHDRRRLRHQLVACRAVVRNRKAKIVDLAVVRATMGAICYFAQQGHQSFRLETKDTGMKAGAVPRRLEPITVVTVVYRFTLLTVTLLSLAHSARAESGLASYYGGRGHKGEMTCAHRTRPFGSMVTVTHAGHSIRCRVNDRGPFVRGRVIDVSVSAARALGMMRSGIVRVSVE